MFIDHEIRLREDMPESLKNDFEILQGYFDADDWFMFDTYFEVVEASVKAHYIAGKISREELVCIFRKYGIA